MSVYVALKYDCTSYSLLILRNWEAFFNFLEESKIWHDKCQFCPGLLYKLKYLNLKILYENIGLNYDWLENYTLKTHYYIYNHVWNSKHVYIKHPSDVPLCLHIQIFIICTETRVFISIIFKAVMFWAYKILRFTSSLPLICKIRVWVFLLVPCADHILWLFKPTFSHLDFFQESLPQPLQSQLSLVSWTYKHIKWYHRNIFTLYWF